MARDDGTSVAISNPYFKLWLVLHHADQRDGSTTMIVGLRRQHDGPQGKGLDGDAYMRRRGQATGRAERMAMMHASTDRQLRDDIRPPARVSCERAGVGAVVAAGAVEVRQPAPAVRAVSSSSTRRLPSPRVRRRLGA